MATQPNLANLPEELLSPITADACLDRRALKAIRLVCRRLERLVRPRLFHTAHLSRRRVHRDNFLRIADNKHLALCVRELVWLCDDQSVIYPPVDVPMMAYKPNDHQLAQLRTDISTGLSRHQKTIKDINELQGAMYALHSPGDYLPTTTTEKQHPELAGKLKLFRDLALQIAIDLDKMQADCLDKENERFLEECIANPRLSRTPYTARPGLYSAQGNPFDDEGQSAYWTVTYEWDMWEQSNVHAYLLERHRSAMKRFRAEMNDALTRLPNLHTLVMDNADPKSPCWQTPEIDREAFSCVLDSFHTAPGAWLYKYVSMGSNLHACDYMDYTPRESIRGICSLELNLDLFTNATYTTPFTETLDALVHLQELCLVMSDCFSCSQYDQAANALLRYDTTPPPASQLPTRPGVCARSLKVPRLQILRLYDVPVDGPVLLDFVLKHDRTLHTVRLDNCRTSPRVLARILEAARDRECLLDLRSVVVVERGWDERVADLEALWLPFVDQTKRRAYAVPADFASQAYRGKRAVRVMCWENETYTFSSHLQEDAECVWANKLKRLPYL